MSLTDLAESYDEYKKKMDGIVRYHKGNQTIVINLAYPYEIDLDRIETPCQLLGWVHHLSEKNWMTTIVLHWFIEKVSEIKKFDIYGM